MRRDAWTFAYQVSELLAMADARWSYHNGRAQYWAEQAEAAKADLRENGIDFRDEVDARPGLTNYHADEPMLAADKIKTLRERQAKLRQHRDLRDAYGRWGVVLKRESETRSLELHYDDVLYFLAPDTAESPPA